MSLRLQGIGEPVVASWWWEPPAEGRRVEFDDLLVARAYLARLVARSGELPRLRRLIADQLPLSPAALEDAQVLDRLASWVATGQLRLVALPRGWTHSWTEKEEEEPAPVWRPPPPVIEAEPLPVAEEATFPPQINWEAIAFVLREAAKSGVAFCEECLKKQLIEKASDPATFPEDLDAIAAAMVMKAAAKSGAPFCEECMKAKLKEQRAAQSGAAS